MKKKKKRKKKNQNRWAFHIFFLQIFKSVRKKIAPEEAPKLFRPYLGPDATDEEVEDLKYQNTRANLKKYNRQEQRKIRDHEIRKSSLRSSSKSSVKKKKERSFTRYLNNFSKKSKSRSSSQKEKTSTTQKRSSSTRIISKEIWHVKNYFPYLVNSISLFLLSYLVVYFFHQLTIWLVAARWGFGPEIYYYDLVLDDFSHLWNRRSTLIISASGPVNSLILALIALGFLIVRPGKNKILNLFLLWISLFGFNFFFGALAAGVASEDGFGFVPQWLFLSGFWQIMLSFGSLILLASIGYSLTSKFLDSSHSARRVSGNKKIIFLFHQAFLPWIIGMAILVLVKFPRNLPYQTLILIFLGFAIVPVFLNRKARPSINYKPEKNKNKVNVLVIVLTGILLVLFRSMA